VLSNPMRRAALLIGALSLLALAGPAASAGAIEIATSQITSPAGPVYALNNASEASPPPALTVEGTTNITSEKIALRCYYAPSVKYSVLASEVEPHSGSFKVTIEPKSLPVGPCILRAVPVSDTADRSPGTPAEEAKDPYHGTLISGSSFKLFTENKGAYDYELDSNTLSGLFNFDSVGDCGLNLSRLYAPVTFAPSEYIFDCDAALYEEDNPPAGSPTRSELQIDGANAYTPATAAYLQEKLKTSIPGAPRVTVAQTFEAATGLVTVSEVDPIVKCSPSTAFPPTASSCKEFVSTGVQLERKWQTSNANEVAWMTDEWKSADGASHALNALYDQSTINGAKEGGAYEFPGENVFLPTAKGETVSLPPGLGKIYYKVNAGTPSIGDGENPQGAIVYDTPPSGPVSVYRGTAAADGFNGFEMPYQGTIPAGGSYTLHMAFVQAYTLTEVQSLAETVLASYPPSSPPALSIAAPANGATVSSSSVTVSGTVSDTRVITSFTVDGQAVSVGAAGAWSTTVTLNQGANTIKALATDQAGFATEKSVSVTYTPTPPVAHASQVGSAHGDNGEVSFTIACTGAAGTSCEIESTATTVERTRNGNPVAVSARHRSRTRSTKVTVGVSKLTIPAGQRITIAIALNAAGRSLLARFGKLPVHLDVVLLSAGHRSTIIAQNLTITPHRRPRQKRHHHHHRR
jgi:hypothetical protein